MTNEERTALRDAVLLVREQNQIIELDCWPGSPRPGDLITGVVKGTVLEALTDPEKPSSMFMGNWTWEYPSVSAEEWRKAQEVTKPRIVALYRQHKIRYGSW